MYQARNRHAGPWDPARQRPSGPLPSPVPFTRSDPDPFALLDLGDPCVHALVKRLRRVAHCDLPILLHGETGTGKELFARAIHQASSRWRSPFVAVNCAAIPEGLVESELFGHRPGAFTGASARGAKGLVEQADGGTLFLDEIGDMPPAVQSHLLRLLGENEVRPVGAGVPVKLSLRIVSATHRDLCARVAEGLFREDLLFRLQGLPVKLPALRHRTDSAVLARGLAAAEAVKLGRPVILDGTALEFIARFSWPGNIRHLKQVLTSAVWLSESATVTGEDLRQVLEDGGVDSREPDPADGRGAEDFGDAADERGALLMGLRRNRWNVTRTALEFRAARTTIYRRMSRLGIVQPHLLDP